MANRPHFYTTFAVTGSPAAAAETIIATLSAVDLEYAGQTIKFQGTVNFTVGTAGNAATLRLRRDTVGGTQIGVSVTLPVTEVVATDTVDGLITAQDTPGDVIGAVYVMTLQVTTANAASTVNSVNFTARVD